MMVPLKTQRRGVIASPAGLALACISMLSCWAGPAQAEAPTIAEIEAAIKARVSRIATVDVNWKAKTHYTEADGRRLGTSPFGPETSQTGGQFPATIEWRAHLWSDGEKLRLEHNRSSWMFGESRFETPEQLLVYDGDMVKSLTTYTDNAFRNQGGTGKHLGYTPGDSDFWPAFWHFRAFTYPGMLSAFFGTDVTVSKEELDGRSTVVLRRKVRRFNGTAFENVLWLDAQQEYAVLRLATIERGQVYRDMRIGYRTDDQGIVILDTWQADQFDPHGELARSTSAEVVEVVINQPIDASRFIYEFPRGAVVGDEQTSSEVLIGSRGQQYPVTPSQTSAAASAEELLASLEPKSVSIWPVGILLLVLAAALAMYFLRRRRLGAA